MNLNLLLEHFGVSVGALSGVLAARGMRVGLFGVLVLALVTAFGGAGAYLILRQFVPPEVAVWSSVAVAFVMRLGALRYKLRLPFFSIATSRSGSTAPHLTLPLLTNSSWLK